jgi:GT2 family glycosyltransferase
VKQGTVAVAYLDGGRWSAVFGMCLRDLYLHDAGHDRRILFPGAVELRGMAGAGGIADGRNELFGRFLSQTEAEWLWFVDTDMGFAKDTVDRLVASADPVERPIVGGLCFRLVRSGQGSFYGSRYGILPTVFDWDEANEGFLPRLRYERDAVQKVDATGAACLLIHRSVAEKLAPSPFSIADVGDHQVSEDLSFCLRAGWQGFSVHVDASVKTTHDKSPMFLDEELYLASRPWLKDG